MELVIIFAIGVGVGSIIARIVIRNLGAGTLRVDTSDSDGPYMFLELSKGVDTIASKKYVVLRVNLKSYIPQK